MEATPYGCDGFRDSITVQNTVGDDRIVREVSVGEIAACNREHKEWMTQTRVDKHGTVYRVVLSLLCTGMPVLGSLTCCACAGVGRLKTYRDVCRRTVFACSKRASRERHGVKHGPQRDSIRRKLSRWKKAFEELKRPSDRQIVSERALRKDFQGVAASLHAIQASECMQTLGDDKQTALAIATNVIDNIMRQPKGRRHCRKALAFATVVRSAGGEALYNCIQKAMILPHESTARKMLRRAGWAPYCASGSREDVVFLILVYKSIMAVLRLPPGSVPFMLSEDETAINEAIEVDIATDNVMGSCGCLCLKCCTHIKICRKSGCPDPHACDPEGYVWKMGDDFDAFIKKVKGSRLSTMARAVLINPLHPGVPTVCILWVGTCGTFKTRDYIDPQWRRLERILSEPTLVGDEPQESVESVLGPAIGHGSDGASTRRREMMLRSTLNDLGFRIHGLQAYVFCGSKPTDSGNGRSMLNMDMDYVHNIKKLINSFASPSRLLQVGPDFVATLEQLRGVITTVDTHLHGARPTDLNRQGYRAMRFPSALRLISAKFLRALDNEVAGTLGGREADPTLRGVRVFLGVIHRYAEIFMDRSLSLAERTKSAGFVNCFLLIWRGWCREFEREHNQRVDEEFSDPTTKAKLSALKERLKKARAKLREGQNDENKENVQKAKQAYDAFIAKFERRKTKGESFVTEEAMKDVVLSCHFIVHLLQWFRENAPGLVIPFWRLGSDVLEDLFSLLGSFIMNKRTYTLREGLQTMRSKLSALLVALLNNVPLPKRERRSKTEWTDDETRSGDQLKYLSDVEIARHWNNGAREAREALTALNMKPARQGGRAGRLPEWWTSPETQIKMPSADADEEHNRPEEEEVVQEEDGDEDDAADDGEDGAGDDDSDDGDGDAENNGVVGDEEGKEDDLRAGDIDDAIVIVDALEDLAHSTTMVVHGVGTLHKQAICARYCNSGLEKVANDIGLRYANLDRPPVFDVRVSNWTVGPSIDIAVKFETGHHLGRIVQVRRRCARGWDVWVRPFDLLEAKAAKVPLHFLYVWYKQYGDVYKYGGVLDTCERVLETIICPVELVYDAEAKVYRLPAEQLEVIEMAMEGAVEM